MEQLWNIDGTTGNKSHGTCIQCVAKKGNNSKCRKANNYGGCSAIDKILFPLVPFFMEQRNVPAGPVNIEISVAFPALFHCCQFFLGVRAFFINHKEIVNE